MNPLSSLSANEQLMLMLVAYINDIELSKEDLRRLAWKLMTVAVADATIRDLMDKRLIVEDNRLYYRKYIRLAKGLFIPALAMLMMPENKKLRTTVMKVDKGSRSYTRDKVMRQSAIWLIEPRAKTVNKENLVYLDEKLAIELGCVLDNADYQSVFDRLTMPQFAKCLDMRLMEALVDDEEMNWAYLEKMVKARLDKERRRTYGDAGSVFAFYQYLATGATGLDIDKLPVDHFSLQIAGIQSLYRGHMSVANKCFSKAIVEFGKHDAASGRFVNPISNFYFLIAMLLLSNHTSLGRADKLRNRILKGNSPLESAIIVSLYDYIVDKKLTKPSATTFANAYSGSGRYALKWLAYRVLKKLDMWPDNLREPSLTEHRPTLAFLKQELAPIGVVPAKENPNKLFGGDSLLEKFEVKALWQMMLEDIIGETSRDGADGNSDTEGPDHRVAYVIEFGSIVPYYQKRLKDNSWSAGRRLSPQAFKNVEGVKLDDNDVMLMDKVSGFDFDIPLGKYIDCLVGCDHVYVGALTDLKPVTIRKEKPCLVIDKRKDGSFEVSTNMREFDDKMKGEKFFQQNSETDYSVFSPSAFELKTYRQILGPRQYPAEAEALLTKLMAVIGGRTEIHSNMVVALDDLVRVKASTKITLRVVPDGKGLFTLTAMVKPFGNITAVPARGNLTILADDGGKKVQVVRSLRAEKASLQQLNDALVECEIMDEGETWQPKTMADTITTDLGRFLPLLEWVNAHDDTVEMEWPENTRMKFYPSLSGSAATISFKQKSGWFEVEGDVQVTEDHVVSLQRLLEMMHESAGKGFVKIGENEYITLSKELERALRRLDTVTSEQRQHLQMAPAAVGLLGDLLGEAQINVKRNKAMEQLRQRIEASTKLEPTVPATLNATLRDYQEEGYAWLSRVTSWGAGACLADDMGLGKTLQTIALMLAQAEDGASVVVAPASVVPNWRNELARFAPTLNVHTLNTSEDRAQTLHEAGPNDVVIMTYGMLNIQQEELAAREWNVLCLDEAHTIKNPGTKMSKAAMTLKARRKVILTGTPIQNHLSELWNLFQFINPGLLGSADQFKRKFIVPIEVDHDKSRQSQLRRLVSPFLLRRTKGEVVAELPDKTEIQLPVELSPEELTMYEVRRREAENAVLADSSVQVSTLAQITRLRQMACSVSLVDHKWKKPASKVLAFLDLAQSLNGSGNRALVFSQFTSFFAEVRQAMDKAELPYLYLDGSTPMKQREQLVKEFQAGTCPFFLISLKAGGLGLNLTGANYVIHLDPWWNPAIEQQATDRAYRIGQRQNVTVYHLISQHTIEEKILRLHKSKRDLADSLLEGADMARAITQEELLELLSTND